MASPKEEKKQKVQTKIRTFAGDLEMERKKQGMIEEGQSTESETKKIIEPTPQMAAPKATDKINRDAVPEPAPAPPKPTPKQTPKAEPIPPAPTISPKIKKEKESPIKASAPKTINQMSGKKIPAFHELQKQSEKIISAKEGRAGDRPNIGYDATVITDTKGDRFKLVPSVFDSLTAWFKHLTTPKKKRSEKYSLPETTRRKGVIQKATSKTGSIFTDDNDSIREKIRQRQRLEQTSTVVSDDEIETVWTPNTESGYALLEEKTQTPVEPQNVTVEYKKPFGVPPVTEIKNSEVPEITVPTEPIEPVPEVKPVVQDSIVNEEDTEMDELRWGGAVNIEGEETNGDDRWSTVEDNPPLEELETDQEILLTDEEESSLESELDEEEDFEDLTLTGNNTLRQEKITSINADTNTQTITVLSIIVLLVIVVVAGKTYLPEALEKFRNEETLEITSPDPMVKTASVKPIILTSTNLSILPDELDGIIASSSGLVEIAVITKTGEEISPSYAFQLFNFGAAATLKQSLTFVRFVSANNSKPVLILKFTDVDSVRGGLLQWEPSLATDLKTVFDYEITEETLSFSDETLLNNDARVLKQNEKTILIYAIVNENTAVIAPSLLEFTQIVELLQKN